MPLRLPDRFRAVKWCAICGSHSNPDNRMFLFIYNLVHIAIALLMIEKFRLFSQR